MRFCSRSCLVGVLSSIVFFTVHSHIRSLWVPHILQATRSGRRHIAKREVRFLRSPASILHAILLLVSSLPSDKTKSDCCSTKLDGLTWVLHILQAARTGRRHITMRVVHFLRVNYFGWSPGSTLHAILLTVRIILVGCLPSENTKSERCSTMLDALT